MNTDTLIFQRTYTPLTARALILLITIIQLFLSLFQICTFNQDNTPTPNCFCPLMNNLTAEVCIRGINQEIQQISEFHFFSLEVHASSTYQVHPVDRGTEPSMSSVPLTVPRMPSVDPLIVALIENRRNSYLEVSYMLRRLIRILAHYGNPQSRLKWTVA